MGYSLEGVELKIARASEHLDALGAEASAYLDSDPYQVVGEPQADGDILWVCKVHRYLPLRLSVVLGDFLHNLRSSLDHLAWQLVLANGGTPERKTTFPILSKKGSKPIGIAGGVSAKAADLVERFQPYNSTDTTPREHPLWVLSTLNNIDKHREFNIAVLNVSDMLQADLLTDDGAGIYMTLQFLSNVGKDKPITDGAVVGKPPFPAGASQKWRIGVQTRLGLQETTEVGALESFSLFTVAERLLDHVHGTIVPEFRQFLTRTL